MELNRKVKTRLYIGLSDEDMEKQQFRPEEVMDSITGMVKAGTFLQGKGLWNGSRENTVIFECIEIEENMPLSLEELKESLEKEFDQYLITVEQVEVETNL